MAAIKVEGLTKDFSGFKAVDNMSLSIKEGEVFGLLGPNGAGKTTTISMLSTLLKPTSGKAIVNGYNVVDSSDDVRKSIGIVFQDPSLDDELTAYENLDFHGRLYHIPKDVREKKAHKLLKLVELEDKKDHLVKTYSGGMKRRLEIARGLLHEPKVLFLDEPTLGLDPQTRNHLWTYIKKLNKDKKITIILTTHYMDEADSLCKKIAIIDHGKIIVSDTPKKLKESIGGDVVTIRSKKSKEIYDAISAPWIKHKEKRNGRVTFNLEDAEKHVAEIVAVCARKGIEIESLSIHEPTLEDVFLHYTGRQIREEEASPKAHMRMRHRAWSRR